MEHDLKTLPEYYQAVKAGIKPFELRKEDDRRFEVGDVLYLREYDPARADAYFSRHAGNFQRGDEVWIDAVDSAYTGATMRVLVTYVLRGEWLADGYVAMGVRLLTPETKP